MVCESIDCENDAYGSFDQCSLHCDKSSCSTALLLDFFKLLKEYCEPILRANSSPTTLYISPSKSIIFKSIKFPNREKDNYSINNIDYFIILEKFKSIDFLGCVFSTSELNLVSPTLYFEECVFEKIFSISQYNEGKNNSHYIFNACVFKESVRNTKEDNLVIEVSLFNNCIFKGDIYFNKIIFNNDFIKEIQSGLSIERIYLKDCIFGKRVRFNYFKINYLEIFDTQFLSKLEIKNSEIEVIDFFNSNVTEVFDAYQSIFRNCHFYKSIFKSFAGFENVTFGRDNKKNKTKFIYTTFEDFSNFRNTKFLSGLDFANVNLKQPPNFLNTEIYEKETNRETFRIIKNSFEKISNHIEANRFFIHEMNVYRGEVSFLKSPATKFVINANYYISGFGKSYIKPAILLVFSIILYTYIVDKHKEIFEKNDYIISESFNDFSIFINDAAINFLPFTRFLEKRQGIELISLFFYIWFAILIWQIIVAIKKHTQH